MSDNDKIVSLVEYRGPALTRPDKANPAIPDHIWDRFQNLGEVATEHLARLLTDPRFPNFAVKEQMRIIETTFARAYGSVDGSVRRHLHAHVNPEDDKGFNVLSDISKRAHRRLPEFRTPHGGETVDVEAVPVKSSDQDGDH